MAGPLSHLRVLDLGRIMAAPWATQILADLGAEVIKIERPGFGDDTRGWGPPFLKDRDGNPTKDAGYFLSVNRGKRSVTLDITKPAGQAIAKRLAQDCDIVIENFKVGALARYGLDAASLRALKPSLIYCSVTGFGRTALPNRPPTTSIQAMCGLMSITGGPMARRRGRRADRRPDDGHVRRRCRTRRRCAPRGTGRGETIADVPMSVQHCQPGDELLVGGRVPHRAAIAIEHPAAGRVSRERRRTSSPSAMSNSPALRGDRPSRRAADPRFIRNADRVRHNAALTPLLAAASAISGGTHPPAAGVPCSPINTVPDVFATGRSSSRCSAAVVILPARAMVGNPIHGRGRLRHDGVPRCSARTRRRCWLSASAVKRASLAAEGII